MSAPTRTERGVIKVDGTPHSVAVSRDNVHLYVTHFRSGAVSVVDTTAASVAAKFEVRAGLYGVAVRPDGDFVYVGSPDSEFVEMINTADGSTSISAGIGAKPYGLAVSQDGSILYAAAALDDAIEVLDPNVRNLARITGVDFPVCVAASPDGNRLYATNYFSQSVSVIDTAGTRPGEFMGGGTVARIPVPLGPYGIAVGPDGTRVYVAHFPTGDQITVIDSPSQSVVDTIAVGQGPVRGIAVSADGARLYATNYFASSVSVINL